MATRVQMRPRNSRGAQKRNLVSAALLVLAALIFLVPRLSLLESRAQTAVTPSGIITRISAPAIQLDSKVVEAGRIRKGRKMVWRVPGYAVGHDTQSGLPGDDTNIVLYGHNNIQGAVFQNLNKLSKGDEIQLRTKDGREFRYRVTQIHIFLEDGATPAQQGRNAQYMNPTDHERLTLISCWPDRAWPPYRIIVIAIPARALDQ